LKSNYTKEFISLLQSVQQQELFYTSQIVVIGRIKRQSRLCPVANLLKEECSMELIGTVRAVDIDTLKVAIKDLRGRRFDVYLENESQVNLAVKALHETFFIRIVERQHTYGKTQIGTYLVVERYYEDITDRVESTT
jgi:hypothetical protein